MGLSMKALAASLRKRSQGPSGSTAPDSCNSHEGPGAVDNAGADPVTCRYDKQASAWKEAPMSVSTVKNAAARLLAVVMAAVLALGMAPGLDFAGGVVI